MFVCGRPLNTPPAGSERPFETLLNYLSSSFSPLVEVAGKKVTKTVTKKKKKKKGGIIALSSHCVVCVVSMGFARSIRRERRHDSFDIIFIKSAT